MDSFKLQFRGEFRAGTPEDAKKDTLRKLGFRAQHLQRLNSGQVVTLKKNLSADGAKAAARACRKLGLKVDVEFEGNGELWEGGLVGGDTAAQVPETKFGQVCVLPKTLFKPIIAALPGTFHVRSATNTSLATVAHYGFKLSSAARFAVALITVYPVEVVWLQIGRTQLGAVWLVQLIALGVFFGGLAWIPPWLASRSVRHYARPHNASTTVVDRLMMWWWPLKAEILDHEGKPAGHIVKRRDHAQCFDAGGELRFRWDAKARVRCHDGIAAEISAAAIDGTVIDQLSDYFSALKVVFRFFRRDAALAPQDFDLSTASPITDANEELVALIYQEPALAYRVLEKGESCDPVLLTFCAELAELPLK